ncbi:hypothetical protein TCAL_08924 [Tigriopus californicus]|uniref:Serpin domain-containing protein n=1 Tax=Tigriopus californicus TaxID=6832 RepID=A0A553PP62_TIGCA|nr:ovalbumin-related protein X-like [Tigriopus californicus]XP_059085413.1 ovalbumin-related protein X-like [Tigriopus californicus]XP_059085414.1 ovalbumin-related protein X-like [Tigriopus californicus]TRY79468.1 hypothetical protein TCAL_08924 [Tigriopus californicus]|eukprot:TCALIF_08924-PA protein Name:"Similar to Serpinb1b Leukocyte elastase inhibitor B (Mus musculus)" AED:0.02 eAED:0.02 QI:298/1/1/1/0.33/0.25/4/42/456
MMTASSPSNGVQNTPDSLAYSPVNTSPQTPSVMNRISRNPKIIVLLSVLLLMLAILCSLIVVLVLESTKAPYQGQCVGSHRSPTATLTYGNEDLSMRMYLAVKDQYQNVSLIMSALSLGSLMAMASLGAQEPTTSELRNAMSLPCSEDLLIRAYQTLNENFHSDENVTLTMVQRIFLNNAYTIRESFRAKAASAFDAILVNMDFGPGLEARDQINRLIAVQTNQKISDLLAPGSIQAHTKLVMVNAVYFKGRWALAFDPINTQLLDFFPEDVYPGQKVHFMRSEDTYAIGRVPGLDARLLKLPYAGGRLAMYLVLPNKSDPLSVIEENMPGHLNLLNLDGYLENRLVAISLPKFQIELRMDLVPAMINLGASGMFHPGSANFSGISRSQIHVDQVVQKAFIEVNEDGTEAAAATGANFRAIEAEVPEPFDCNRPFLFLIKDLTTGVTIFFGRYMSP